MSTRIGIVGCTGRLGGRLGAHAARAGIPVVLQADSKAWHVDSEPPDVVIDVSRPAALAKVSQYVRSTGTPLLTAVSGYGQAELAALREVADAVPVMHVKNLSVGHLVHKELARTLFGQSRLFEGIDSELLVVDRHPGYKLDKPSATALALQETLRAADSTAPEIFSIRGGMPVCEHEIVLSTFDEEIVVTHRVRDWSAYATTAIRFALWLASASTSGFHDVDDVFRGPIDPEGDHAVH